MITKLSPELKSHIEEYIEEIETDNVSLSGWIAENLGKIAAVGDHFEYKNLSITVTAVDSHRVDKARVIITPAAEEEEESKPKKLLFKP